MSTVSSLFDRLVNKVIGRLRPSFAHIPLLLFFICALSFLPLANSLGFYGDEWHMLYSYASGQSEGLFQYFYYDGHPTIAWIYEIGFNLLGLDPFAWHLFAFFWKYLSGVLFWLLLNLLWPERRLETVFAAIIFMLYPRFYMNPMALAYFETWFAYAILWVSFYFSVRAVQSQKFAGRFHFAAILLKIIHVLTSEYTWGIEFVRGFFLWAAYPDKSENIWTRLKATARATAIYWLITIGVILWRVLFYASPVENRARPILLQRFFSNPLETLLHFSSNMLLDLFVMVAGVWNNLFQTFILNEGARFALITMGLVLISCLAFIKIANLYWADEQSPQAWEKTWIFIGFVGMIVGALPFYAAGYFITSSEQPFNGRFTLGSLAGISLFFTAVISFFITSHKRRVIAFAILTGLMVCWQNYAAGQFRSTWRVQENIYRQLIWRAPSVAPGTAFVFDSPHRGAFIERAKVFVLNTIYEQHGDNPASLPYWSFHVPRNDEAAHPAQILYGWNTSVSLLDINQDDLADWKYDAHFTGKIQDAVYIVSSDNHCLWVIEPEFAPYVSTQTPFRFAAPANRIFDQGTGSFANFEALFGKEQPRHQQWCYFFQKASLARQYKNWDKILTLWQEARNKNLGPRHGLEYLPFIAAQAHSENWEEAFLFWTLAILIFDAKSHWWMPI